MTLDTRIYILDRIDPHEAFRFCRDLVGATDRHTYEDTQDATYLKASA